MNLEETVDPLFTMKANMFLQPKAKMDGYIEDVILKPSDHHLGHH